MNHAGVEGIREWNQRRRADEAIPHLLGADLLGADLSVANLSGADLSNANLFGANLVNANLFGANLVNADLLGANLSNADLLGANLSNADLSNADLSNADLSGAKLLGADLLGADLSVANLSGADLGESQCGRTIFADVDLSEGASIQSSTWDLARSASTRCSAPTGRSRKHSSAGVARRNSDRIPSVHHGRDAADPVLLVLHQLQFQGSIFAERLYADLQGKGVRC